MMDEIVAANNLLLDAIKRGVEVAKSSAETYKSATSGARSMELHEYARLVEPILKNYDECIALLKEALADERSKDASALVVSATQDTLDTLVGFKQTLDMKIARIEQIEQTVYHAAETGRWNGRSYP